MYLEFHSDDSNNAGGFQIQYSTTGGSTGGSTGGTTGGSATGSSTSGGSTSSGATGGTSNYKPSKACIEQNLDLTLFHVVFDNQPGSEDLLYYLSI